MSDPNGPSETTHYGVISMRYAHKFAWRLIMPKSQNTGSIPDGVTRLRLVLGFFKPFRDFGGFPCQRLANRRRHPRPRSASDFRSVRTGRSAWSWRCGVPHNAFALSRANGGAPGSGVRVCALPGSAEGRALGPACVFRSHLGSHSGRTWAGIPE